MSFLLKRFIKSVILESLTSHEELSELQAGTIRDEVRKSIVFRRAGLDVESFASDPDNADSWSNILSHGQMKYLGSGRQGSAFSLGPELVLKLEKGPPRAQEIETALYSGAEMGVGLPKVLDAGVLNSSIGQIGWSIVEKMQEAGSLAGDPEWNVVWKAISNGIRDIVSNEVKAAKASGKAAKKLGAEQPVSTVKPFSERDPWELARQLESLLPKAEVKAVEERYRLLPDWLDRFVVGLMAHYRLGMVDFKPDNMGIRRIGPMGEIIFFDAASAKLRSKKMWEPKAPKSMHFEEGDDIVVA